MQKSDFAHFVELPVRWGDLDSFGHVNNVQYMRYLESGRIAYVEQVMNTPLEEHENIILADIQCAFLAPLRYPATVEVATRISRLGRTSFDILCAIYRKGEQAPAATGKGVIVWYDYVRQQPAPIPPEVREAVRRFEAIAPQGD